MIKLCVLVFIFGAALAFPSKNVCLAPTDPPTSIVPTDPPTSIVPTTVIPSTTPTQTPATDPSTVTNPEIVTTTITSTSTTTAAPEEPIKLCGVDRDATEVQCDLSGADLPLTSLESGTYHFSDKNDEITWCEAFIFCKDHNMILAHAYNKEILQTLDDYHPSAFHFWVGTSDKVSGELAKFQWTNGDDVDATLWKYHFQDTTNCGVLCSPEALHSYECTDKMGYICQVPNHCL